jgi:RNA polymerase sigma factor (sigma-70 family)
MTDWDLLEQFTQSRCERAFGELVARHSGLVYATCRRRLRDPHLAEDATQAVFVVLARRPPARHRGSVLSGWLYQTAIYTCNNMIRSERLHRRHERRAIVERERAFAPSPRVSAEVEVQLDNAMSSLSASDRSVLLMRYYENLDLRQIGAALGVSEKGASKRAARAMERLRGALGRAGTALSVNSATAALGELLRQPAPLGLIQRTAASVRSTAAATSIEAITQGVMQVMMYTKAKLIAAVTLVFVLIGGASISVPLLFAQASQATSQPVQDRPPKEAMREFVDAFSRYDAAAARALVDANGERGRRMLKVASDYLEARHDFHQAIRDKFNADPLEEFPQLRTLTPLDFVTKVDAQTLDQFEETIENDVATLKAPGGLLEDFVLVRQDGVWKFSADAITAAWSPQQTEERAFGIGQMTAALKAFTKQIKSGKYQSLDELHEALQPLLSRGR